MLKSKTNINLFKEVANCKINTGKMAKATPDFIGKGILIF